MTTQALKLMFPTTLSDSEMELVEQKLQKAENKELSHRPCRKFPRASL